MRVGVAMEEAAREQFVDFVRARGAALQRTAFLLTGDWGMAEDLLQTALARSYLSWHRIRHDDPEGYVRRVLGNTYAKWWRRKWRGELPVALLPERSRADGLAEVVDRTVLMQALARLPYRQRLTLVMRFHEDMTESQVARVLGCTVGTVKSQTAKALARLRADQRLTSMLADREGREACRP